MVSEYYAHYHRWEPLAEFHFYINGEDDIHKEGNYVYCLCSRTFIRDGVRTYYVDKEDASDSDNEIVCDSRSQDIEDQFHVHFSLDDSCKVKCEKDEGASCYCSASHTDNYCSTDEHDPQLHLNGISSNALQPSDSGADLTYQDCQSDNTSHDKIEKMDEDIEIQANKGNENYFSEDTWEKFWAINGERIIWASWIEKYSDYINPSYLDDNSDLLLDENIIPKPQPIDPISDEQNESHTNQGEHVRERKFSFDSKVNPFKKGKSEADGLEKVDKSSDSTYSKEEAWLPLSRRRSCSEHERIVSPRTFVGTDSMTNVTKMTLSSHDVTSSHVTSESTSTDGYSVSSSPSDDQSNDQTRIANLNADENIDQESEEMDTEQYWQFLWKKHFGELYALHYANYIESREAQNITDMSATNIESEPEKIVMEVENVVDDFEEMSSVNEVQEKVEQIKLEDNITKTKKRSKKASNKYIDSVGRLLQNLLKEQQKEINEIVECGEGNNETKEVMDTETVAEKSTDSCITQSLSSNNNLQNYSYDDGDDDPPEEKPISLKSSHEIDDEEVSPVKISATFEIMGFCVQSASMPKGQLVYKKRFGKLRPPRSKKFGGPKKTYFDDDGNPYTGHESYEEREMQTDDENREVHSDNEKVNQVSSQKNVIIEVKDVQNFDVQNKCTNDKKQQEKDLTEEAASVALPPDLDNVFSDTQDEELIWNEKLTECAGLPQSDQMKRRRRQKRYSKFDASRIDSSDIPLEIKGDPKMLKYWKKRHSLFHKFDDGIILDRESWFSVTPENVAWHIASKFAFDTVIDAFCGAGGNTIQFAHTCKKVIAIDIDPAKIEMAKHNAKVYGVDKNIEFMVGDFFKMASKLAADMVFLSPPWGGPNYSQNYQYDIETMLEPKPATELMTVARSITSNIALYLPRNTRSDQIVSLAQKVGCSVEVEQSYLDKRFVAITAYFY